MPRTIPRILLVNDDSASLLALSSILEDNDSHAYQVVAVQSGQAALREVLRGEFAVIFLDVNMPGMDGYETAAAIRSRPQSRTTPIIFITAFKIDELDRAQAYASGAADFLFTPIIPQVLRTKANVFVTLYRNNQQAARQALRLEERSNQLMAANRHLEEAIEKKNMAQRGNAAKDEFLAMLGHELRNPLSAIRSASAIIGMTNTSAESQDRAKAVIKRQSQHMTAMTHDVLELSRVLSGKVKLTRSVIDAAAILADCLQTLAGRGTTGQHSVAVTATPAPIHADRERVMQMMENLIENAVKFSPPGGAIDVGVCVENQHVVFSVRDQGAGIDPEDLPFIFDVFVQGTTTIDRSKGGLGLGLALVKLLAELHEAGVEAISAGRGTGSTFVLRFPLHLEVCATGMENHDAPARHVSKLD